MPARAIRVKGSGGGRGQAADWELLPSRSEKRCQAAPPCTLLAEREGNGALARSRRWLLSSWRCAREEGRGSTGQWNMNLPRRRPCVLIKLPLTLPPRHHGASDV